MQREIITVSEKHSLRTESVRCFPQFAEVSCQIQYGLDMQA